MNAQINKIKNIFAVFIMIILMIATRGHDYWLTSFAHLSDFTLPALFIAGVYFRAFWVAFTLIIAAVMIDNYAIVYEGVSAHCITPAYSILPFTYYGVFWSGKYLTTLKIDDNIAKNSLMIVLVCTVQWLIATLSYYAFTTASWAKFPAYAAHWSVLEIPANLYWMVVIMIVFTLAPHLFSILKLQKSAG